MGDGQEYAQVTRMLGNGRLEAFCFDGVNRLCHIRGKLRKRVWIGVGDIVLLGLREFQDQKADIILKYDGDEARSLKSYNELPETVQINAGAEALEGEEFGDDNFDFDEVDEIYSTVTRYSGDSRFRRSKSCTVLQSRVPVVTVRTLHGCHGNHGCHAFS